VGDDTPIPNPTLEPFDGHVDIAMWDKKAALAQSVSAEAFRRRHVPGARVRAARPPARPRRVATRTRETRRRGTRRAATASRGDPGPGGDEPPSAPALQALADDEDGAATVRSVWPHDISGRIVRTQEAVDDGDLNFAWQVLDDLLMDVEGIERRFGLGRWSS
jgi:hypothetical protein